MRLNSLNSNLEESRALQAVTAFRVEVEVTYLKHFLDTVRVGRTILGDVGTEDAVSVWVRVALLVGLVVAQLLKDRVRHVRVQVVDEDVLRHVLCL